MKKYFIVFVIAVSLLSSCTQDESLTVPIPVEDHYRTGIDPDRVWLATRYQSDSYFVQMKSKENQSLQEIEVILCHDNTYDSASIIPEEILVGEVWELYDIVCYAQQGKAFVIITGSMLRGIGEYGAVPYPFVLMFEQTASGKIEAEIELTKYLNDYGTVTIEDVKTYLDFGTAHNTGYLMTRNPIDDYFTRYSENFPDEINEDLRLAYITAWKNEVDHSYDVLIGTATEQNKQVLIEEQKMFFEYIDLLCAASSESKPKYQNPDTIKFSSFQAMLYRDKTFELFDRINDFEMDIQFVWETKAE